MARKAILEVMKNAMVTFPLPKQDVRTRWTSTHRMLSQMLRFKTLLEGLHAMQLAQDLTEVDMELLEHIVPIIEPIAETIGFLEGDTYPTFMLLFRRMKQLQEFLRSTKMRLSVYEKGTNAVVVSTRKGAVPIVAPLSCSDPKMRTGQTAYQLCTSLEDEIFGDSGRFCFKTVNAMIRRVGYLNVSDDLSLWTASEKSDAETWLKGEYELCASSFSPESEEPDPVHTLSFKLEHDTLQEVRKRGVKEEKLLWYWTHPTTCARMPVISTIVQRYLPLLASSAPSERAFSRMTLQLTKLRHRLSPERLQELVMVSANWKVLMQSSSVSRDATQRSSAVSDIGPRSSGLNYQQDLQQQDSDESDPDLPLYDHEVEMDDDAGQDIETAE